MHAAQKLLTSKIKMATIIYTLKNGKAYKKLISNSSERKLI